MRTLFLVLVAMLFVTPGFSQTVSEYNKVMKKLVRYINKGQVDKMNRISTYKWTRDGLADMRKSWGKITSYQFMMIDSTDVDVHSRVTAYFAAVTERQWLGSNVNALAFALTDDNKLSSYRIMTKSDHSDSMLRKYYYKAESFRQ